MDELEHVACLCPSGRFYLLTLLLATWTKVKRFVLVENDRALPDVAGFDAVMVMDEFVTRERVAALAKQLPVIVLAWNGMFEIDRYRDLLAGVDNVIYLGPDESLDDPSQRYIQIINGHCALAEWRHGYVRKRQFAAHGSAAYRLRWAKAYVRALRWPNVATSLAGDLVKRRDELRDTLTSALLHERLVWVGNCFADLGALQLVDGDRAKLEAELDLSARIASINAIADAEQRLHAALAFAEEWSQLAAARLRPEHAYKAHYMTNTLQRWAALGYLSAVAPRSVWFIGSDNVGLGLRDRADVYNLVPNHRVAFLDFGGKGSRTRLYARTLQLLVRECYVIDMSAASTSGIAGTAARIHRELAGDRHEFFRRLEERRRPLYHAVADSPLATAQERVWADF